MHILADYIPLWPVTAQALTVLLLVFHQCNMLKPGLFKAKGLPTGTGTYFKRVKHLLCYFFSLNTY